MGYVPSLRRKVSDFWVLALSCEVRIARRFVVSAVRSVSDPDGKTSSSSSSSSLSSSLISSSSSSSSSTAGRLVVAVARVLV